MKNISVDIVTEVTAVGKNTSWRCEADCSTYGTLKAWGSEDVEEVNRGYSTD